nr:hypothetical protein [Thaumasiovibrio subtropicus]
MMFLSLLFTGIFIVLFVYHRRHILAATVLTREENWFKQHRIKPETLRWKPYSQNRAMFTGNVVTIVGIGKNSINDSIGFVMEVCVANEKKLRATIIDADVAKTATYDATMYRFCRHSRKNFYDLLTNNYEVDMDAETAQLQSVG